MSVVIIGGNERMVTQYENICKEHGCKAKVFAKENGSLKKKIGCPDLLILFIYVPPHIHEKPYKKLYLRVLVSCFLCFLKCFFFFYMII